MLPDAELPPGAQKEMILVNKYDVRVVAYNGKTIMLKGLEVPKEGLLGADGGTAGCRWRNPGSRSVSMRQC